VSQVVEGDEAPPF